MFINISQSHFVRRVFSRLQGWLCFCFAGMFHHAKNPRTCVFCMIEQTMSMSDVCLPVKSLTCERRLALLGKNNHEI